MSQFPNPYQSSSSQGARGLDYASHVGESSPAVLRFFNAVYAWMATGLALTALVAWWVSSRPDVMQRVFRGPVIFILFIAEMALVVAISAAVRKISASVATGMFLLYSALNGLTLSVIFIIYTHASITSAFVVTALMFGAMSVYGMITRTDLSRLGNILFMALIGLVIASVVNLFFANSTLYWIITYAGVIIFVGLTAYDTQKLRGVAIETASDAALAARLSVSGALMLYLDFLNLFLLLLRVMGDRRT
jgi:FtsH-binding integral membrane protein